MKTKISYFKLHTNHLTPWNVVGLHEHIEQEKYKDLFRVPNPKTYLAKQVS